MPRISPQRNRWAIRRSLARCRASRNITPIHVAIEADGTQSIVTKIGTNGIVRFVNAARPLRSSDRRSRCCKVTQRPSSQAYDRCPPKFPPFHPRAPRGKTIRHKITAHEAPTRAVTPVPRVQRPRYAQRFTTIARPSPVNPHPPKHRRQQQRPPTPCERRTTISRFWRRLQPGSCSLLFLARSAEPKINRPWAASCTSKPSAAR